MSDEPAYIGPTEENIQEMQDYWKMFELEQELPDIGPREVVERVRVHVVEVGNQIWDVQSWRTVTEIREPGQGPNETLEPQRHFKWEGNEHWHYYGEWMLRLVGDLPERTQSAHAERPVAPESPAK